MYFGTAPLEKHISIRNLDRSLAFYRDVVGLEVGLIQSQSQIGMGGALFWVGGRGRSMLGVFSLGATWPLTIMQHHVAFQVKLEDVLAAPQELRADYRASRVRLDARCVCILRRPRWKPFGVHRNAS
jgi:catechol 2,3-dioxygenase-like lactoylglutathione lyase family enzyme